MKTDNIVSVHTVCRDVNTEYFGRFFPPLGQTMYQIIVKSQHHELLKYTNGLFTQSVKPLE